MVERIVDNFLLTLFCL